MRQFFIRGADHINYRNSEVGPNDSDDGMNWITAAVRRRTNGARDIVFDRVRIHDFKKHNSGAHVDCIGIDDVDGLVIHRTRGSGTASTSRSSSGRTLRATGRPRNVLIQNTFLDCCYSGYYSIGLGDVEGPMRIRFNSLTLGIGWLGGTVRGVIIRLERDLEQQLGELRRRGVALQRRRQRERVRRPPGGHGLPLAAHATFISAPVRPP